jgi:hypothetical protein
MRGFFPGKCREKRPKVVPAATFALVARPQPQVGDVGDADGARLAGFGDVNSSRMTSITLV